MEWECGCGEVGHAAGVDAAVARARGRQVQVAAQRAVELARLDAVEERNTTYTIEFYLEQSYTLSEKAKRV